MLAVAILGRGLLGAFGSYHLGRGVDSSFLMWALVWWPHAIRHALNPFLCKIVWVPDGFNLAWSGGVPLAAIVAAPLTSSLGPIASYNLLTIFAVIVAAWACFFLCYEIGESFWPALLGGYLFGFSPYMLGQAIGGHLNLMFVFPAPLLVLVSMRALATEKPTYLSVLFVALLFVAQFLLSIELAATVVLFGSVALLLGWFAGGLEQRRKLLSWTIPLAQAAVLSAVILAPYLYYLFLPGAPSSAINSPGGYSADLANLVVPTPTSLLGTVRGVEAVTNLFPGNIGERGAYLGIPLLALIVHFGWTRWNDRVTRILIFFLVIVLLFALGPRLRVVGLTGFGMPWKLAMHLPMIKHALPGRFMSYAFLAAAVIATLWFSASTVSRASQAIVGTLVIVALIPNPNPRFWAAPTPLPEFFSHGTYRDYLHADETVVTLPFGISGGSMLWQAAADMIFAMAGGYTGITPREYESWPAVRMMMTHTYTAEASQQLIAMMVAHRADRLIVDDADRPFWESALASIETAPRHVDGVWLYQLDAAMRDRYRNVTALEMESRDVDARFSTELRAAQQYLAAGHDRARLTPLRAQQLGLLPAHWVNDPDVRTVNGLYLGPWSHDRIAVGVVGSYDALRPLIEKYRVSSKEIFFPFPRKLEEPLVGDNFMRLLVMVFDLDTVSKLPSAKAPSTRP